MPNKNNSLAKMIRKELDPFESEDKFAKAGRAAEEQMAFYLKRFFDRKADIHVINGIRIEMDDDAAQMDHLVLHPFGITIVESKSVQGKVQIKDDGQWIRWYNDFSKGMASPVTQARLQVEFLKTTLGRAARSEEFFETVPFDTLVAISDAGVILWPKTGSLPNVCKADQVADKITARIETLGLARKGVPLLSPGNTEKIIQYLIATHKPLIKPADEYKSGSSHQSSPIRDEPAAPEPTWSCKHCGSAKLAVQYGHNYFFHCLGCEKNMPIKPDSCEVCGEPERVRKQGKDFFFDCKKCEKSRQFYTNS